MKPVLDNINIIQTTWYKDEAHLRAVRTPVFIQEQAVTPEFEWDEIDVSAVHLLAMMDFEPIACLRIINHHKIGRMAVLKQHRGIEIGRAHV